MSLLFTDLSTYIRHIPSKSAGINLTKDNKEKEIFTDGKIIYERKVSDEVKNSVPINSGFNVKSK
jgi:hypothetical protein